MKWKNSQEIGSLKSVEGYAEGNREPEKPADCDYGAEFAGSTGGEGHPEARPKDRA